MSITFAITPDGGSTQTFAAIAPGSGVFAVEYAVSPVMRRLTRFHAAGVAGNITVRDQPSGRTYVMRGMICDTLTTALNLIDTLFDAWRASPVSITTPTAAAITECNLLDARMLGIAADGTAEGGGYVEIAIEMSFTKDAGY